MGVDPRNSPERKVPDCSAGFGLRAWQTQTTTNMWLAADIRRPLVCWGGGGSLARLPPRSGASLLRLRAHLQARLLSPLTGYSSEAHFPSMNAKTLGRTRGISLMDREEKLLQSEASFERARRFHFTGIDSEEHLLCSLILGFL